MWLLCGLAWAGHPTPAVAEADPERWVVIVLLVVAMAYLLAHFVVDWLQKRFLFVSGFEYILLGAGLGYLSVFHDLTPLGPILALAAGWVGLVYGMELDLRELLNTQDGSARIALFEGLGSGVAVAVVAHFFFASGAIRGITPDHAWLAAGVMGCAGAAGSASAIDLVSERYGVKTDMIATLRRTAGLGDLVAIGVFGLIFCLFHKGSGTGASLNWAEWTLMTVGIGVALGVMFTVFLGDDESENSRFLALVGIIAFASGAAFFLNLSLLAVNLILGMVVANSMQDGAGVRGTLQGTRRPMSLVLLFFSGALWVAPWHGQPLSWTALAPTIAITGSYIAMRMGGKLVGCWIGTAGTGQRRDIGRGLLAQGDEALAMALSLRLVYEGPAIDLAYTAILGSVMVHELLAPRLLKGLLVDAGQIRRERDGMPPADVTPSAPAVPVEG